MSRIIRFECLDCASPLEAEKGMEGEIIECDNCGKPQSVPAGSEEDDPLDDEEGAEPDEE
jgi:hypothetical protein